MLARSRGENVVSAGQVCAILVVREEISQHVDRSLFQIAKHLHAPLGSRTGEDGGDRGGGCPPLYHFN